MSTCVGGYRCRESEDVADAVEKFPIQLGKLFFSARALLKQVVAASSLGEDSLNHHVQLVGNRGDSATEQSEYR